MDRASGLGIGALGQPPSSGGNGWFSPQSTVADNREAWGGPASRPPSSTPRIPCSTHMQATPQQRVVGQEGVQADLRPIRDHQLPSVYYPPHAFSKTESERFVPLATHRTAAAPDEIVDLLDDIEDPDSPPPQRKANSVRARFVHTILEEDRAAKNIISDECSSDDTDASLLEEALEKCTSNTTSSMGHLVTTALATQASSITHATSMRPSMLSNSAQLIDATSEDDVEVCMSHTISAGSTLQHSGCRRESTQSRRSSGAHSSSSPNASRISQHCGRASETDVVDTWRKPNPPGMLNIAPRTNSKSLPSLKKATSPVVQLSGSVTTPTNMHRTTSATVLVESNTSSNCSGQSDSTLSRGWRQQTCNSELFVSCNQSPQSVGQDCSTVQHHRWNGMQVDLGPQRSACHGNCTNELTHTPPYESWHQGAGTSVFADDHNVAFDARCGSHTAVKHRELNCALQAQTPHARQIGECVVRAVPSRAADTPGAFAQRFLDADGLLRCEILTHTLSAWAASTPRSPPAAKRCLDRLAAVVEVSIVSPARLTFVDTIVAEFIMRLLDQGGKDMSAGVHLAATWLDGHDRGDALINAFSAALEYLLDNATEEGRIRNSRTSLSTTASTLRSQPELPSRRMTSSQVIAIIRKMSTINSRAVCRLLNRLLKTVVVAIDATRMESNTTTKIHVRLGPILALSTALARLAETNGVDVYKDVLQEAFGEVE